MHVIKTGVIVIVKKAYNTTGYGYGHPEYIDE
jgi:hypothetical protein